MSLNKLLTLRGVGTAFTAAVWWYDNPDMITPRTISFSRVIPVIPVPRDLLDPRDQRYVVKIL